MDGGKREEFGLRNHAVAVEWAIPPCVSPDWAVQLEGAPLQSGLITKNGPEDCYCLYFFFWDDTNDEVNDVDDELLMTE